MRFSQKTFLFLTILLSTGVFAQPGDPCPIPPCDPDVPITGIEVLLVAGGVYGFRKLLFRKK